MKTLQKKIPNLIICGFNKAGTTSLHTYLSWHPDICTSSVKETNYFVPLLYNKNLHPIETYSSFFKHCDSKSKYILESTPRYVYGGERMAKAIYEKLGSIKIMVLIRDPIDRLFSYYRHMKENSEIDKNVSFDEYVNEAIACIQNFINNKNRNVIDVYKTNVYVRGLAQGFYGDFLAPWFEIFGKNIKVLYFEELKDRPSSLMNIICDWLGLNSEIYESANYSIENRRINYRSEILHNISIILNDKFEIFLRKHSIFKNYLRQLYYLINESTTKKEIISEKARKKLKTIYQDYNTQLKNLLSQQGYIYFPDWLIPNDSQHSINIKPPMVE